LSEGAGSIATHRATAPDLREREAADIPRLAAIVQAVRDNRVTVAEAKGASFKP
jgi:hypothetical protein